MNFINFTNKDKLIQCLLKINDIVNTLNTKCKTADYWAISDGGAEYISIHKETHDENYPLESGNWKEVRKIYPEIDDLMDNLNLHRFIGKINTTVWPIHRHVYDLNSAYSLTVFAKNVDNSILSFYDIADTTIYTDNLVYDTKSYSCDMKPEISVSIKEGDIYCINTWIWHSYDAGKNFSDVFLLYPKNITSPEEKNQYIEFLKNA